MTRRSLTRTARASIAEKDEKLTKEGVSFKGIKCNYPSKSRYLISFPHIKSEGTLTAFQPYIAQTPFFVILQSISDGPVNILERVEPSAVITWME